MAEDWRVSATVESGGRAAPLLRALHEREVRNELREELGGRVAVSSDGPTIFLYANTRHAAEAALGQLREALAEHGLSGQPRLDRWRPDEERWESADAAEERPAEEEDDEHDVADWEVRVELDRHADAVALASELEAEGVRVVRRWRYLLVGAATREEAETLATRIRDEAPRGARIAVEPGLGIVWELRPANPFAVFGGLGA